MEGTVSGDREGKMKKKVAKEGKVMDGWRCSDGGGVRGGSGGESGGDGSLGG
jgi:hypothetical protein